MSHSAARGFLSVFEDNSYSVLGTWKHLYAIVDSVIRYFFVKPVPSLLQAVGKSNL